MSDVGRWLDGLGLGQYAVTFAKDDIDWDVLAELDETDLEKLGLSLGHRKKLLKAITGLAGEGEVQKVCMYLFLLEARLITFVLY